MKRLFLSVAIVAASLTSFASTTILNSNEIITIVQEEYTEITSDKLPEAVLSAIKNSYPDATIDKAYVNEKKEYKIEEVNVAFRAVVVDRRPIIGAHSKHKNMFILNGLGARGVMNSNFFSKQLFEHIEFGKEIFPEVDIKRFQ